ncbi:MAG: hypothetical protein IKO30_07380 [Lachnospiraceae bacterium]|nr:hypothetical protein [Lachnospiraceae bacterium]
MMIPRITLCVAAVGLLYIMEFKKRCLPMGVYIILFVTAFLLRAAEGDIKEALAGMIPAALMLAVKLTVPGGIDKEDIAAVFLCGICTSFEVMISALFYTSVLCCVCGLIKGKIKRSLGGVRISFLPLLALGILTERLVAMIG